MNKTKNKIFDNKKSKPSIKIKKVGSKNLMEHYRKVMIPDFMKIDLKIKN